MFSNSVGDLQKLGVFLDHKWLEQPDILFLDEEKPNPTPIVPQLDEQWDPFTEGDLGTAPRLNLIKNTGQFDNTMVEPKEEKPNVDFLKNVKKMMSSGLYGSKLASAIKDRYAKDTVTHFLKDLGSLSEADGFLGTYYEDMSTMDSVDDLAKVMKNSTAVFLLKSKDPAHFPSIKKAGFFGTAHVVDEVPFTQKALVKVAGRLFNLERITGKSLEKVASAKTLQEAKKEFRNAVFLGIPEKVVEADITSNVGKATEYEADLVSINAQKVALSLEKGTKISNIVPLIKKACPSKYPEILVMAVKQANISDISLLDIPGFEEKKVYLALKSGISVDRIRSYFTGKKTSSEIDALIKKAVVGSKGLSSEVLGGKGSVLAESASSLEDAPDYSVDFDSLPDKEMHGFEDMLSREGRTFDYNTVDEPLTWKASDKNCEFEI